MKKLGFLSLLVLLMFSSCRKDTDMVTVTEVTPDPEIVEGYQPLIQIINGDLIGQVLDFEGSPISEAVVKMGTNNTTTDIYGHFFFNDVDMNSKGQYVTIEKEGFFLGSRRFFPQTDAKSRVKVEMLSKNFNQSFNTNGPETVSFGNVNIDFPANGIVTEAGTAYNGTVYVAAKWLDPTTKKVYDQMPGNLQGVNTTSEEVALKTLGMVAVELQGENGEKLNIMEGAGAGFSYIIPEELRADAPTEIPLWSFNEEIGIWVEEGVSTLSSDGTTYSGEFSHFSFWNWDIPEGNVYFSATFQDQDGNPIQNVLVTLTSTNYGSGYGYTDDQGYVSGIIPAGNVLTMEVWAAFGCASSFYSEEIGPFDADVDLATIVLEDTSVNATSISGNLIDCDGDAVQNGVVLIALDGYTWYNYTEDGTFSFYLNNCAEFDELSLVGYDIDALLSSNPIALVSNTDNPVGAVSVCDNDISENIITFSYSGNTFTYLAAGSNTPNGLNVYAVSQDSVVGIYFGAFDNVTVPGDYTELSYVEGFENYSSDPAWSLTITNPNGGGFESFIVTEVSETNVAGNFSAMMIDNTTNEEVLVEGTFNIDVQ
ncbi:MAG: hypothetical protein ACI85O_002290 [Saprospiraceae bacterium]|jgi:hypothetical protein